MESLAHLLKMPSMVPEPFQLELQNIELAAQFFTHINVSLSLALVLGTPFILYQLWLFIKPALYDKERKVAVKAFAWCSLLFFWEFWSGTFCVPTNDSFLGNYKVTDWVENQITLQSYIHMFTWLILIMGVVFEMPILLRVLSKLGIVSKDLLKTQKACFYHFVDCSRDHYPQWRCFYLVYCHLAFVYVIRSEYFGKFQQKAEEDDQAVT